MSRSLILGQVHPDFACAVALGVVEYPRVVANAEAITIHDERMCPLGTVRNWLTPDDALDAVTREYLAARRAATATAPSRPGQSGWGAASAAKTRDEATKRAVEARNLGRGLLAQRGVLAYARGAGLKLIGVD